MGQGGAKIIRLACRLKLVLIGLWKALRTKGSIQDGSRLKLVLGGLWKALRTKGSVQEDGSRLKLVLVGLWKALRTKGSIGEGHDLSCGTVQKCPQARWGSAVLQWLKVGQGSGLINGEQEEETSLGQEVAAGSLSVPSRSLTARCFAFLQEFEQDSFDFQQKVEDIDRRLGTVFIQAFDDASDLEHAFKVCLSHPFSFAEGSSGCLQFALVRITQRSPGSAVATGTQGWCLLVGMDSGTVRAVAFGLVLVSDAGAGGSLANCQATELAAGCLLKALGVVLLFPVRCKQNGPLFSFRKSCQNLFKSSFQMPGVFSCVSVCELEEIMIFLGFPGESCYYKRGDYC